MVTTCTEDDKVSSASPSSSLSDTASTSSTACENIHVNIDVEYPVMSQNIYDSDSFFDAYSKYPRAIDGLEGASEWPQLRAMLPSSFKFKSVLDLGCGDGWFSRWAATQGAKDVVGLDVSRNMLDTARARTVQEADGVKAAISFGQVDLEGLKLPEGRFDVVFSGLALHYVHNLPAVIREIYKSLKPGGIVVFSVEHPIFTAPTKPGFMQRPDSVKLMCWPLNDYFAEGFRGVRWLGAYVKKEHRTVATYLKSLHRAGFQVKSLDEWGSTEEQSRVHPNWPNEGVIPRFLLVSAQKPAVQREGRMRSIHKYFSF
jgi:SAM-dependent methyltransferase